MRTPDPAELEQLAIRLARGAADVVRAGGAGRTGGVIAGEIDAKSTATDLVTEVDRRTERWLSAELTRERPGDGVLGEEGAARPGDTPVRWLLDPIDGTVNFVLGIPQYAVSVAAEVAGTVVAGAVCNPVSGETFYAHQGGGAWLDGRRLSGPREVPLERAVIGTGFGYDARMRARQAAALAPLLPRIGDVRRLGSAALDLCFVAAGRLDGYYEVGLNKWDFAAGALVAAEAGCGVSGRRGAPPSGDLVVVAGASLLPVLLAALEGAGADTVAG